MGLPIAPRPMKPIVLKGGESIIVSEDAASVIVVGVCESDGE
jgi:hypothetical protein